jgi:diguanylate cyclase (GGDEF)-like protein
VRDLEATPPVHFHLYLGRLLWALLLGCGLPVYAQAATTPNIDRAEQLSWADAPAALRLLDKLKPPAQSGELLVQWLMVRGLADADSQDEVDERAIDQQLTALGTREAVAAAHIVKAYVLLHGDQFDRGAAELQAVGADAALPAFERFRLQVLRGDALILTGQPVAARSTFEKAIDLANDMHSPFRTAEAMTRLGAVFLDTGNLDGASTLLAQARATAQRSGDVLALGEISTSEAELADHRGDRDSQQRALIEALDHAQATGSDRLMTLVLVDLGEFNLKIHDYATALGYSTRALVLAGKLRRPLLERLARFDMGMAQVGLEHLMQGKRLMNSAIQQGLASGDLVNSDDLMRQALLALEKAGDLRGALDVVRRDEKVHEQLMTTAREQTLLELSGKFDDERRARQIELLERDNAIKSRDLKAQRLRQQMIMMAAALIVLTCGALAWGISRIRKINARLVNNSRYDALTGLLNRRYFNDYILAQQADRPYVGCLLMINVDRLQQINDTFGYAAGDEVLTTLSERWSGVLHDSDALVRWGGETVLGMLGPMSEAQLNLAVRSLLAAMRGEPVAWNGHNIQCTVSIGYASFPVNGVAMDLSLDRAIALVGKARRQAKQQGGDRGCLIELINADNDQDLCDINAHFEDAASDRRVRLAATDNAAVPA